MTIGELRSALDKYKDDVEIFRDDKVYGLIALTNVKELPVEDVSPDCDQPRPHYPYNFIVFV